jgi:hypothetical protein
MRVLELGTAFEFNSAKGSFRLNSHVGSGGGIR